MRYFLLFRIIPTILSIQLASLFGGVRFVEGAARFTETPPSVLYVSEGGDANFTWDYHVDDRDGEFSAYSPKWSFYENATITTGIDIAFDNQFRSWAWEIASSCPPRLLNPTVRVSKESTATLLISNVTTADSGIYGCSLVFQFSQPKPEKSQLIVTVRSQITITGERSVPENRNVTLNCSAVGPPTPNVTWINSADVVLEQGIQSAVLIITNITLGQNGTIYKCNATNNPNELPVQKEIIVTVKLPPELDRNRSKDSVETCPGKKVEIVSAANGYPDPTYYWYNPLNVSVGENKTGEESKIKVDPVPGNWTCHITNGAGQDIYFKVQMTVLPKDHINCTKAGVFDPPKGCTTAEIIGFVIGLLIALAIIIVIVVVIYKKKKEKKEWKEWTTLEKVLIPLGLIVAIIIIIVVIVFIIKCAKKG